MNQGRVFTITLLLAVASIASSGAADRPVVKLAFYAPRAYYWPDQAEPPVHIVGFAHGAGQIQYVVSNASDKTVSTVVIQNMMVAPSGCTPETGDL